VISPPIGKFLQHFRWKFHRKSDYLFFFQKKGNNIQFYLQGSNQRKRPGFELAETTNAGFISALHYPKKTQEDDHGACIAN
jgi:hypothetical protein